MFGPALVLGILALATALLFASRYVWDFTGIATTWILNAAGMKTDYVSPIFLIYVRLMDGTLASFLVLTECSGLVTVAIFVSFIHIFTIGLLNVSVLKKITWFLLSLGVGLAWNINRLAFVIIIAYNFGLSVFSVAHYLLGPFIDFLWVVTMWSLGMSWVQGSMET